MTFIRAGEPAKSDYVYYAELERDFRGFFLSILCHCDLMSLFLCVDV